MKLNIDLKDLKKLILTREDIKNFNKMKMNSPLTREERGKAFKIYLKSIGKL